MTDQHITAGETGFKDILAEGREDGLRGRDADLRDEEACEGRGAKTKPKPEG